MLFSFHVYLLSDQGGDCPSIQELIRVPGVTQIWYKLGIQLGIGTDHLDIITMNHPQNAEMCKIKMFDEWLRCDTNPTLMKFVKALVDTRQTERCYSVQLQGM